MSTSLLSEATLSTSDSSQSVSNCHDFSTDIGNYLQGSNLCPSDFIKVRLLEMNNIPSNEFVYPFSVHLKKGKEEKRYLKKSHFENYPWLVYSPYKGGLFCKYCVLFAVKGGKDKNVTLNKFVNSPLTKFAKIMGADGDFSVHSNHLYHKNAVQVALDFLNTYKNPQTEIVNVLNSNRMKTVAENRERLRPIIESILFLGRQNIALRGHRDQGILNTSTTTSSVINEGNFRELLKFRVASGDAILEKHLKTCNSKATYISHTTQENIIDCIKDELLTCILNDVKNFKYYSVVFDETTDVSHVSQLSLILRYIDNKNNVHEKFVGFINCHDDAFHKEKNIVDLAIDEHENPNIEPKLTGEVLGNIVVSAMQSMSLDLNKCVGIGTDGCSVMTSVVHGAVQRVQTNCENAIFSPCSNHALNLSISKSSNVHLVCITEWNDVVSSSKAKTLLLSICTCDFVLTLYTMTEILSVTAAASRILQGTAQDIVSAENCIDSIVKNLEDKRLNSVPRTSKRQTHRSNTPASNPEEYYRRVLYIPILDNVLEDLRMRFYSKKNRTVILLMQLVPVSIINMSPE
ncbi:uncharacterized protein LOC103308364, partial [Acyrthosiphon pisum]|uniref:DUF4371 domain-containing protein n=1 Tax=Acyrthosiphon pisum TaxID=7029 RepID=A0A8R2NVV1_ACYPI